MSMARALPTGGSRSSGTRGNGQTGQASAREGKDRRPNTGGPGGLKPLGWADFAGVLPLRPAGSLFLSIGPRPAVLITSARRRERAVLTLAGVTGET
jgi:hypothetical protein